MVFYFNIISTSNNPVSIAIFVNPTSICTSTPPDHVMYYDMFPVAWKLCKFPGGTSQGPLTIKYDPTVYQAFLGSTNVKNTITPASLFTVTPAAHNFTITDGPPQLEIDGTATPSGTAATAGAKAVTVQPQTSISISNTKMASLMLGVADGEGALYVGIQANDPLVDPPVASLKEVFDWTDGFEFAVAIVTELNVEAGKIYREGRMTSPFITFSANDVSTRDVSFTWNGLKLLAGDPSAVTCPSSQRIFDSPVRSCCFFLY